LCETSNDPREKSTKKEENPEFFLFFFIEEIMLKDWAALEVEKEDGHEALNNKYIKNSAWAR
jgi:hypothetical protein